MNFTKTNTYDGLWLHPLSIILSVGGKKKSVYNNPTLVKNC